MISINKCKIENCNHISHWLYPISPERWVAKITRYNHNKLYLGNRRVEDCLGELEGNGTPFQYSCLENPWTEEPGGLQSMGSLRVRYDWASSLSHTVIELKVTTMLLKVRLRQVLEGTVDQFRSCSCSCAGLLASSSWFPHPVSTTSVLSHMLPEPSSIPFSTLPPNPL